MPLCPFVPEKTVTIILPRRQAGRPDDTDEKRVQVTVGNDEDLQATFKMYGARSLMEVMEDGTVISISCYSALKASVAHLLPNAASACVHV